mgnify:CR=1 FL=1
MKKPQLNSKAMGKLFNDCAKKRFGTDQRLIPKFVEAAQRM